MKISLVCHGNIARSQILHHYLAQEAQQAGLALELFSCDTATRETYPDAAVLLAEVQGELARRGLHVAVQRHVLDPAAEQQLASSDWILVADDKRRQEVLNQLGNGFPVQKIKLFYEFIGEGQKDFVDTYDASKGAQDPARFARCFDELARIARRSIAKIQTFD